MKRPNLFNNPRGRGSAWLLFAVPLLLALWAAKAWFDTQRPFGLVWRPTKASQLSGSWPCNDDKPYPQNTCGYEYAYINYEASSVGRRPNWWGGKTKLYIRDYVVEYEGVKLAPRKHPFRNYYFGSQSGGNHWSDRDKYSQDFSFLTPNNFPDKAMVHLRGRLVIAESFEKRQHELYSQPLDEWVRINKWR